MLKKKNATVRGFLDTGLQIWGLYVNMVVGIKIVHRGKKSRFVTCFDQLFLTIGINTFLSGINFL